MGISNSFEAGNFWKGKIKAPRTRTLSNPFSEWKEYYPLDEPGLRDLAANKHWPNEEIQKILQCRDNWKEQALTLTCFCNAQPFEFVAYFLKTNTRSQRNQVRALNPWNYDPAFISAYQAGEGLPKDFEQRVYRYFWKGRPQDIILEISVA